MFSDNIRKAKHLLIAINLISTIILALAGFWAWHNQDNSVIAEVMPELKNSCKQSGISLDLAVREAGATITASIKKNMAVPYNPREQALALTAWVQSCRGFEMVYACLGPSCPGGSASARVRPAVEFE